MTFLAVLALASALVDIAHPFPIRAARDVAEAWNVYPQRAPEMTGDVSVILPERLSAVSRLDVLEKREGRWRVMSTSAFVAGARLPRSDRQRGVLVRVENDPRYWWTEIDAGSLLPATLTPFRTLTTRGVRADELLYLYLSGRREESPIDVIAPLVPATEGLVCATSAARSTCVRIDGGTTNVQFDAAVGESRVVLTTWDEPELCNVLSPGRVTIRPRHVPATFTSAGRWRAVTVQGSPWADLVLECKGRAFAMQRWYGANLVPPPGFASADAITVPGIDMRALVGDRGEPLTDQSAMLVAFDPDQREIPLATSTPNSEGVFSFPDLGAGNYSFQLLSATTGSTLVGASVLPQIRNDVSFPAARLLRGRVLRTAGGTATDPVFVELGPEVLDLGVGDVLERTRFATADASGRFALAVADPGAYFLNVRWGTARARRRIEIRAGTADVDLGTISLETGVVLRGTLQGCAGGQAVLVPLPDPSKPLAIGLVDVRRAKIDGDGRFVVEGLSAGTWSVLAECTGARLALTPSTFRIEGAGDVVIEFVTDVDETAP